MAGKGGRVLWGVGNRVVGGLRGGRSPDVTWPLFSATPQLARGAGLYEQSGRDGNDGSHAASSVQGTASSSAEGHPVPHGPTSSEAPECIIPGGGPTSLQGRADSVLEGVAFSLRRSDTLPDMSGALAPRPRNAW